MQTAVHVMKRLLLVVVGYLVGVVASLIAVVILYFVLSSLPGAPAYFALMGISPLLIVIFPPAWLVVFFVVVVLTALPSLAGALISELFAIQAVWFHAPLGAAIAAGAFVYASPELVGAIGGTDWADLGIVAAAGLAGGVVYWAIAGQNAGFARPSPMMAV